MAQLVEHILGKDEVVRSNRIDSSTRKAPDAHAVHLGLFLCQAAKG